jgi:transcription-repair coupling factor (superfamily II helicase)
MHAIGFNLYMELLERAVKALKSGKQPELTISLNEGVEIKLNLPALIPDDYIGDVQLRLTFYKRIANASDQATLHELQVEMIERFGLLPLEVKNLLRVTEIKQLAQTLKIEKISANAEGGLLVFNEKPNIDPAIIIRLIQRHSHQYKLTSNNQFRFILPSDSASSRLDIVYALLQQLSG